MLHPTELLVLDLDHTLINCNSSYAFGRYLYTKGWFGVSALLKTLGAYGCHKLFGLSLHTLHSVACKHIFCDRSLISLQTELDQFLSIHLESFIRPSIASLIASSPRTLLLSASPSFIVEAIGKRLGVDESIGAEYSILDGQIQGVLEVIDGWKKEKVVEAKGIPWKQIAFYTDSYLDLPLLKRVGHPVVVCPDSRLRKQALEYGWQVEDVDGKRKNRCGTKGRRAP